MALEIVAHRGASDEAPENTREAVEAAWKAGADAVEVDVRLTADGKLAVIHDEDAKRTTGTGAVVAKSTLEDLRKLDAGSWKGPRWKGCRIPTLEEVLATVPRGKRLFVEVKCGAEAVPELARVLRESGRAPREAVVIGFDPETMAAARRIRAAGLELHVWTVDDPEVARRLRALGVDGITTNRPAALRRAIEG